MGDHQRREEENGRPRAAGLYDREAERDACGIGIVADIGGKRSRGIVEKGLEVLERMEHRGAAGADGTSGDGAGILVQVPGAFLAREIPGLPPAGSYGTGLAFLPAGKGRKEAEALLAEAAGLSGLSVFAWRDVPTVPAVLGPMAASAEPRVRQVVLVPAAQADDLELRLYVCRKRFEKALRAASFEGASGVHLCSLSSRTLVYKGMLTSGQLRAYYPDLSDPDFGSAVALVHSRFSTNTFPSWPLAQPFRMIAHNGEINTVKGNRIWMAAREALFSHPTLGEALKEILPAVEPGKSDSASFDNVLELLVMAGRSLPHALMMMVPESWNEKNPIPRELKSFYEYHACLMEPWDGPASIVFCDGRYVGGTLDRNGLRPSRWAITKDGLLVMASEVGVLDFDPAEIASKGRLTPGKLLLVDLEEGRLIPDAEAKEAVYRRRPYGEWVARNVATLASLPELPAALEPDAPGAEETLFLERAFGYTREDRDVLLATMAETGQEPTSSMGTDTPLAVLSDKSQRLFAYFKQVFAQVTNPPIDPIREELVMTLTSFVGRQANLLAEGEEHCRRLKLLDPVLSPADLARLRHWGDAAFIPRTVDATFYVPRAGAVPEEGGRTALEAAVLRLVSEAEKAVDSGATLIVLSDRSALEPEAGRCPVPSLLAAAAVHHGLIRSGRRALASVVVESAEPREVMHFALLFGYGADAVVPYGALASVESLCRGFDADRFGGYARAEKYYLKGIQKALLKIISKMGISTLRSYRGAQVFESVGLGAEVLDACFPGTEGRVGGIGFAELQAEAVARYREAREAVDTASRGFSAAAPTALASDGQYRWRKRGERHAWNPETIYLLQWATREGDYAKFKEFTSASDALNRSPHVLRGLLDFAPGRVPVPLEEVEPEEAIMKRFATGAMSFGSISKEAHEAIAVAMNSIGGRSNSGEGGEEPERALRRPDGTWARSATKQVASGRFGVTSDYLAAADEIQIKIAQGAKPGEGGQLPGHKVDALIAKTRHATAGVTLISPPPHHDIYSIEDLAELIHDLRSANPQARISVKLVSESGVGTIAAGVAKARADAVLISGYDGGTGASPQSSIRHAGLPWELGLAETQQALVSNGLRGRVRVQTDGQLKSGRDVVVAGLLGAEEFGFGTSTLVVLGCVMMRKCHENTCPMGVATQDPALRERFKGRSEHLVNFFRFLARETREIMAGLGVRFFDDLVGRSDWLVQAPCAHPKAGRLDLSRLLFKGPGGPAGVPGGDALRWTGKVAAQGSELEASLVEGCLAALDRKVPVSLAFPARNVDRAVGATLSYEVSRRFGADGLPDNFATVDFSGSAGQSFGAFLAPGITFRLAGDANDYLGKGLSGGRIVLFPPAGSTFKSHENVIVGNTVLYGATRGEAFIAGLAGERFCVRNSGVTAVVEGTGDHCAEYMTGGRLVVLGRVGRNFAAGMSGGIAYVLDAAGDLDFYLNKGMVELSRLDNEEDEGFVKDLVRRHAYWTGSAWAKSILDAWETRRGQFVKVLPVEYKRALQQMKLAELDRKLYEIREREDIGARA